MTRLCIVVGGLFGCLGVGCGAFGAHGLKQLLESSGQAGNWETGARYCLVHALLLVAIGLAVEAAPAATRPILGWAAAACIAGTAIFSGCLWALALSGFRPLGAVVPIGGTLLVVAWLLVAWAGSRMPHG